ncbi:hypothetical protein C6500_19465 [Candidatus Poribacteria bacterium]|nr:MAG: hypothetical protein C6500_19465 [Candidatus Poribacteria bacterium]
MDVMKSRLALSLICLSIYAVSLATAEEHVWTFDNDASDWTPANGSWEVEEGVYKQTMRYGEAQKALVNGVEWADHTLEAKVRVDDGHWGGIVFRAQNEFEYYVYLICPKENKSELWRHKRSTAFKDGFEARDEIEHDIEPIGLTITRNEWFTLRVDVEGSRIAVAINDIEQGVFVDDTYPVGKVGVWTWDTQASFDDVSVNGSATASLTAIEPRGKLAVSWAVLKRK